MLSRSRRVCQSVSVIKGMIGCAARRSASRTRSKLSFAAFFQLADGLAMASIGSMRGYKDTFGPMKIMAISYWGVGLPLGIILSITDILTTQMGAVGMWTGMASGLLVAAVLMVRRVRKVSTKFINEN